MTRGSRQWRADQAKRQEELNKCLSELAELGLGEPSGASEGERQDKLKRIAERLNDVYSDEGFRHRYSEIIEVIHRYDRDQSLETEKRLDKANERGAFLQDSLKELLTHECDEGCDNECQIKQLRERERFERLYDHVRLEAKRAGYDNIRATGIIEELRGAQEDLNAVKESIADAQKALAVTDESIAKAQKELDDTNEKIAHAQEDLANVNCQVEEMRGKAEEASKKAEKLQAETVSILGVFSAIILAFNASVTFSTSSIAAVDATPPFNVAFVVSIVGLMLFNCLYCSFALIYRIIRPENSPEHLLNSTRVAGIEICAVSCAAFLGMLTFFNGCSGSGGEILALGIDVMALFVGFYLVWLPGGASAKRKE